jgi:MFS family permease
MLIVGRAIAGVGGSGLMNGGFTIIAVVSPVDKRPRRANFPAPSQSLANQHAVYLGVVMAFIFLGFVAGPLLGGIITQYASWRWCELTLFTSFQDITPDIINTDSLCVGFYINLPIGAVSAFVVLFTHFPSRKPLSETTLTSWESFKRLDPIGFLTFAPACIMLLLALQWGGTTHPWKSATIIGLFCGFFATLSVFVAWEHQFGDDAMMPLSLLRRRIVYSSCIVSVGQMGGVQIMAYYLPIWFQVIKGASPSMSGVYFMGTVGPQIILALLSGALSMLLLTSPSYVACSIFRMS